MKQNKIKSILIATSMLLVFGAGIALADSSDVTTEWIIPADTTFAISYPNSESQITFETTGQNFTNWGAKAQTDSLAALRITNNGNTAISIQARWTADWPAGITFVNISVGDNTNSSKFTYGPSNETTNQTIDANLAISGTEDFWFWSSGVEVAETTGVARTLRIYSTNI